MEHSKMDGCVCRSCMGKAPMPENTKDYPPMGDYRWVMIGDHWEKSMVSSAGTLVIPKPDYYSTDTKKFSELLHVVAVAHGLDPRNITSIKSWEDVVAVHLN